MEVAVRVELVVDVGVVLLVTVEDIPEVPLPDVWLTVVVVDDTELVG